MKKSVRLIPTMLAAAVLAVSISSASAAGGEAAYNQVNVRFFDQQKIQAGETITAPNGRQVPSSITYTDTAGAKTTYLSIRQIAELMDADIRWDSATETVEIAGSPKTTSMTITENPREEFGKPAETGTAQVRQFGQVIGPFEEIDPDSIKDVIAEKPYPLTYMKDVHIQHDSTMPPMTITAAPGTYLVYTVTNNGTSDAVSSAFRQPTIAYPRRDSFPAETIAPGETFVQAFKVAEGANPLTYSLCFGFRSVGGPEGPAPVDMTASLVEYPQADLP